MPFLVVGVLAAGFNAGCQALINSGDGSGSRDGAALVACKQAVKAQLNYPATADFQTFSTTIEEDSIRGIVEARNAFGVPAEITYVCERSGGTVTSARLLNG